MSDELLYKLALRLSTHISEEEPKLLVGSIPESLPIPIPLPDDTQVVGSLIEGQNTVNIVLDVPGTQKAVRTAYEQKLVAQGWWEPREHRGGFVHTFSRNLIYSNYIHDEGWSLNIRWSNEGNAITGINLHLQRNTSPVRKRGHNMLHYDMHNLFPALLPPDGEQQEGGGGSAGNDMVSTRGMVSLQEEWKAERLATHYTDQLREAGWTPLSEETANHSAWSTWSFRDPDNNGWLAAFYLFRLPGNDQRYELSLRADLNKTQ